AIEASFDRDQLRRRRDAARVISVIMTENEVVDLLEPGLLGDREDPLRVPSVDLPAGIDQERFPRRGHNQRGGAALDVNPVHIKSPGLRLRRADWNEPERDEA